MLAFQDAVPPSEEKVKLSGGNESYPALVWRRLKHSWSCCC
jgi:peptide/nickel transport system permease protein